MINGSPMGVRLGRIEGTDLFGLFHRQLELAPAEMNTHRHIIGIPASGKSKLIESIFLDHLRLGIGTTLIDPAGGVATDILSRLIDRGYFEDPESYERLLYIEFADDEYFFPLNVLKVPYATAAETASIVIESFMRAYPEIAEGAANFYKLMDASSKVLIANNLPIIALEEMINVKEYRDRLLFAVHDPHVKSFFQLTFDKLIAYHRQAQSTATLNRAYDVAASTVLRLCLGQQENGLDVRKVMDGNRFVIINLGRVKDQKTRRLLGAFLTHSYEQAAFSRLSNSGLPAHHLILDEFGAFTAKSVDTFADILTRARQFGLFITLAHQDWTQTNPKMRGALGSCRVKVSFNVNPEDAKYQAQIFADFDSSEVKSESPSGYQSFASSQEQYERWVTAIKTLPDRHAFVRIHTRAPVLIRTPDLPPVQAGQEALDAVRGEYFRRYYTRKNIVIVPLGEASKYTKKSRGRD